MKIMSKLDRYLEDRNYQINIKKNQLNILNFKEIVDFNSNKIVVRCDSNLINIEGKDLIISKLLEDEVLISGIILSIRIS